MNSLLTNCGLKQTKPRLSVLKVLKQTNKPLTAEEIYLKCQKDDQSLNLSTVYRTLDIFLEKGIVIKPLIKEDSTACFTLNHHEHKHYLICSNCKKMLEIEFCPFDDYEKRIENETNFTITNHKFELFGICPSCKDKFSEEN